MCKFCTLLLLALSATAAARSSDPPERRVVYRDEGRFWTMTAEYPDVFDPALAKKLDSGFAMNLVARAWLFREGAARPEALAVRHFRVAYDLWDEVYLVEERDDAGTRTWREPTRAAAMRRVTTLDRLPVAETARMPDGARYHVAVLVEVNPVSPELLAQVRRWLANPPETHRFAGAGESFFGSFVSIFVNPRIGDAEKVLRFQTQVFARRKP
jgi:hypothetical protein